MNYWSDDHVVDHPHKRYHHYMHDSMFKQQRRCSSNRKSCLSYNLRLNRGNGVRYLSVSLSPTLSKYEKVEHHIRKKTHKSNALKFWVEDGVILLFRSGSCLILFFLSPWYFLSSIFPTSGIIADGLCWWPAQTNTIWSLYRKSSWQRFQESVSHLSV